ncbi:MAG: PAS domain S-box protein [Nitrospirae bacterium]|nr:PAS domain S-box protein [Nitrospirota bacterium]
MFKNYLVRNILLISFISVLILAAYNVFFVFPSFRDLTIQVSEDDSVRIATHLANRLLSRDVPFEGDAVTEAFRKEAERVKGDFGLMKVLVFSSSGETVYSSDPADLGHMTRGRFSHDIAAKGRVHTEFVRKDTRSVSGQRVTADAVETYVPLVRDGRFLGACEVYMDVTESKAMSDALLVKSLAALFVLVGGLLAAFVIASFRANRSLTAQRKAEEALRESELFLQTIIETEPECVKLLARDGALLRMNRAGLEMIGAASFAQVKGESVYDLVSPEYRAAFRSLTEKTFEGTPGTLEFEMVGLHGDRLWLETHAVPIRDAKGEIFASLGITRNITERKKADEKLKLFSHAIEEATDGIQITDLDGSIIYANEAVEEIYGFPSHEFLGKHVSEISTDREFIGKVVLESIRETGRWNGELMVCHKDGTVFPIWLTAALVRNDAGKPIAIIGIIRDMTLRKRSEEEIKRLNQELQRRAAQIEESYRDLESFSYTASHDLREPLMIIRWFCGNLLKRQGYALDHDGRETLAMIREKAGQMTQLISDLLSFSRISTKEVLKSEIDMETLAKDVFTGMKASLDGRNVTLEVKDPPAAWGDFAMIRQVLANLLSNALKYTRPKTDARIEFSGFEKRRKTVYYVRDNGVGFDAWNADKLFSLFQRLEQSQEFQGTGVGLVITRKIVEKHGGRVWAEGKTGGGATFYFSLPGKGSP